MNFKNRTGEQKRNQTRNKYTKTSLGYVQKNKQQKRIQTQNMFIKMNFKRRTGKQKQIQTENKYTKVSSSTKGELTETNSYIKRVLKNKLKKKCDHKNKCFGLVYSSKLVFQINNIFI